MKELKEASCGVECGGAVIPSLLFADDTSLFVSDGPGVKNSLDVLVRLCDEWGAKINVQKSGIMHIRQKKMERADVRYVIDNVEIPVVSQYKHLGCAIDEHLELNGMVEEKAMAGKKALGAWFSRCRVELGDIGVGTFRKLMTSLVESAMLYGAEIWGCNRNMEGVEQTQLRALRMCFGVGTLHPKASLLAEMGELPVRWRAKLRCMLFWVRVLFSDAYDGRLIR